MPVPPIYLRVRQNEKRTGVIREVIDGQQRISTLLDFRAGKFKLSGFLDQDYKGKSYKQLSNEQQDQISTYSLMCEIFHGISDSQVLAIFARLNTYSVPLNDQELRNGTYFGYFKQSVYRLALEHLTFWRRQRIFTDRAIGRMLEAELTSELVIAMLDGMQDKKKSIKSFYVNFNESYPERARVEEQFRRIIDEIQSSLGSYLSESEFTRAPLFYTLFCVVFDRLYGMKGESEEHDPVALNESDRLSLRTAVMQLSEVLLAAKSKEETPRVYERFVIACQQQTDNLMPRKTRFQTLKASAFPR